MDSFLGSSGVVMDKLCLAWMYDCTVMLFNIAEKIWGMQERKAKKGPAASLCGSRAIDAFPCIGGRLIRLGRNSINVDVSRIARPVNDCVGCRGLRGPGTHRGTRAGQRA